MSEVDWACQSCGVDRRTTRGGTGALGLCPARYGHHYRRGTLAEVALRARAKERAPRTAEAVLEAAARLRAEGPASRRHHGRRAGPPA